MWKRSGRWLIRIRPSTEGRIRHDCRRNQRSDRSFVKLCEYLKKQITLHLGKRAGPKLHSWRIFCQAFEQSGIAAARIVGAMEGATYILAVSGCLKASIRPRRSISICAVGDYDMGECGAFGRKESPGSAFQGGVPASSSVENDQICLVSGKTVIRSMPV